MFAAQHTYTVVRVAGGVEYKLNKRETSVLDNVVFQESETAAVTN